MKIKWFKKGKRMDEVKEVMGINKSIGVIVGRFQIDDLHQGHLELIDYVKNNHKRVIIFVGVTPYPANRKNPLDFQLREFMLREACQDMVILPIMDTACNLEWSQNLDHMIKMTFPFCNAVLYGGRDSFIKHYEGQFETKEISFSSSNSHHNASEYRSIIGQSTSNSSEFRKGVIYTLENLISRTYLTVDIALVKGDQVLMGKKPHEPKWRFPGGFVDFNDESIEDSAKRELMEETGLSCEGALEYLCSQEISDWRSSEDTRVMTCFFKSKYTYGAPRAGDDLSEVGWVKIGDINQVNLSHRPLMSALESSCKI